MSIDASWREFFQALELYPLSKTTNPCKQYDQPIDRLNSSFMIRNPIDACTSSPDVFVGTPAGLVGRECRYIPLGVL